MSRMIDPRLAAAVPPTTQADLYAALQEICQSCTHWQDGKCQAKGYCDAQIAWAWDGAPEEENAPC